MDRETGRLATIHGYPTHKLIQVRCAENFKYLWLELCRCDVRQAGPGSRRERSATKSGVLLLHNFRPLMSPTATTKRGSERFNDRR
jgi:hypothetical protein